MTATPPTQQTMSLDALLEMGRSGDIGHFFQIANAALTQGCNSDPLRLLLMQRLLERGLIYRAQAYAEGLSEAVRSHADFAGMWQQLSATSNNGLLPLSALAPRFEVNMAVLRERYAWAGQVAETWAAEYGFVEFHLTQEGRPLVFDRRPPPKGGWKPSFNNHLPPKSVEEFKAELKGQILPALAIHGVGLGHCLPWLFEATIDTFLDGSAKIFQLEPSYLALAAALHLVDWSDLLSEDRVHLCCGPDVCDQLERAVKADPWNTPPRLAVNAVPWDTAASEELQTCTERLMAEAEEDRASLQASVEADYKHRDSTWWHKRYSEALTGKGPPLRVLTITSRFTTVLQYSMRDAVNAFSSLGCETQMLIEPNEYSPIPFQQKLEAIRVFKPDLIFLIDHTRKNQTRGMVQGIPLVTWIQDRLDWLFSQEVGESMGPLDFCMGFCRNELVSQYGYPAERFLACEMATDSSSMHSLGGRDHATDMSKSPTRPGARFICDVAYATNYSNRADVCRAACQEQAPALVRILDAVRDELSKIASRETLHGSLYVEGLCNRVIKDVGVDITAEMQAKLLREYAIPLTDRLLRIQTIEWISDWAEQTGKRFHLYGQGWEQHPKYSKYAQGYLRHGPELGEAFRGAKINIHASMNWSLHQRVLDGISAGGFFLVHQHASDFFWSRFRGVIRTLILERGLKSGDEIGVNDMPPSVRDDWLADRRMRGVEDDTPYVVSSPEFFNEAERIDATNIRSPLQIWPDFGRLTFATHADFTERMSWFLARDAERQSITDRMRESAMHAFSYRRLLKRVLGWVCDRLD